MQIMGKLSIYNEKHVMKDNQIIIWNTTSEIYDYLSKLGGAAWPRGVLESEIPSYVIAQLLKKCYPHLSFDICICSEFKNSEYLSILFSKVEDMLSHVYVNKELIKQIKSYYDYFDGKLKQEMKSKIWGLTKKLIDKEIMIVSNLDTILLNVEKEILESNTSKGRATILLNRFIEIQKDLQSILNSESKTKTSSYSQDIINWNNAFELSILIKYGIELLKIYLNSGKFPIVAPIDDSSKEISLKISKLNDRLRKMILINGE